MIFFLMIDQIIYTFWESLIEFKKIISWQIQKILGTTNPKLLLEFFKIIFWQTPKIWEQ